MRKFIAAIILLLGVVFLISSFAEMQAIWETLQKGDWRFLFLALIIQGLWVFSIAALYQSVFHVLGIQEKVERLVLVASAANFVNVVAPAAGFSGMAVFISEMKRTGHSTGKVTLAGVLYVLLDYAGFLCILTLGLVVLFRRNHLDPSELIATAILMALALSLASLLYVGTRSAEKFGNILAWLARIVNSLFRPFLKRVYLSELRAHEFAEEAAEGFKSLGSKPITLIPPLIYALINKSLLIFIFFLMFLAFNVPYSPGTIVAGFSIAYLFLIVSPTPAGIGIVEGMITLVLHSFNIPLGAAAVVALTYRGFTFWLPLLFGFISFKMLEGYPGFQVH